MARAKRTDRADARRRYRQTVTDDPDALDFDNEAPQAAAPAGMRTPAVPGSSMGFTQAMRAAWHRPDIRSDLLALPWLLRTRAFLVPFALVVAGSLLVISMPSNPTAGIFYQLMVLPPAMVPIFIAGFFAKRASYLLGFVIAVVDVVGYAAFVYSTMVDLSDVPVTAAHQQELVLSAAAVGPVSGIVFAAGAAWYRRFLAYSSRRRVGQRSGQQRPKASRSRR